MRDSVGLFETTRLRLIVLPHDLGFDGQATYGRCLALAELGWVDYLSRAGVLGLATKRGARLAVGGAVAKFRYGLTLFRRCELHTRLIGWDHRWVFTEHQFVFRGRHVGQVVTRCRFPSHEGALRPQELLDPLTMATNSPRLPDWVVNWSAVCDAQRLGSGLLGAA